MTIRQIAEKLKKEGLNISYRQRKDGGVLVTKIGSQKFKGASGNKVLREMAGVKLSPKLEKILKSYTEERISFREVYKKYLKVKKDWKNVKRTAGEVSFKKVRWQIKHHRDEVMQYLSEKEKYASGIAYSEVVNTLKEYIEALENNPKLSESQKSMLQALADEIDLKKDTIRDEWIEPAYNELYKVNIGLPIEDIVNNVRRILRLN